MKIVKIVKDVASKAVTYFNSASAWVLSKVSNVIRIIRARPIAAAIVVTAIFAVTAQVESVFPAREKTTFEKIKESILPAEKTTFEKIKESIF